jgi:hypothetical protein
MIIRVIRMKIKIKKYKINKSYIYIRHFYQKVKELYFILIYLFYYKYELNYLLKIVISWVTNNLIGCSDVTRK